MNRIKALIKGIIPMPLWEYVRQWRYRRRKKKKDQYFEKHLAGRPTEEVFTRIYKEGKTWRSGESVSGKGSTLAFTANLRPALSKLIKDRNIRVLFDAPCGDFNWMKEVELGDCKYIGGDIVRDLIDENIAKYEKENRKFVYCDIIRSNLPKADMIMCRDCLFHMPFRDIKLALKNFKASGSVYLLSTTFPGCSTNVEGQTGGYRDINLCKPPFNLPDPIDIIDEQVENQIGRKRILGLWELDSIEIEG